MTKKLSPEIQFRLVPLIQHMQTMRKAGKISNIRLLYHSLSEQIIADDLASLKFLCGDYLTPVRLEKIDNAKQLLSAIGEVVESESKQLELLKELFEAIGRRDLKSKVEEFQQSRKGRLLYSLKNTINDRLVSTKSAARGDGNLG